MLEIFTIYLLESNEINKNWRIKRFNNVDLALQLPQVSFWEEAIAVLRLLPQVTIDHQIDHQIAETAYPQRNQLSLVGDSVNKFILVIPLTEDVSYKENSVYDDFNKIEEPQYIFLTSFAFINNPEQPIITQQNSLPLLIVSQIADLDSIFEVENKHVFHSYKVSWVNLFKNELKTVREDNYFHRQWLIFSDFKGANLLALNAPVTSGNYELIENSHSEFHSEYHGEFHSEYHGEFHSEFHSEFHNQSYNEYYSKAPNLFRNSSIINASKMELPIISTNLLNSLAVQDSTTNFQSTVFSWVCNKENRKIGC